MLVQIDWLAGCLPDLPTPFTADGSVDLPAVTRMVERSIVADVSAIVVCATSGEAATMTAAEQEQVIRVATKAASGRVKVVAGAGSNSTSQAIALTRCAEAAGADAILSIVPYYSKPAQDGICAHFQMISSSTSLPVILHDAPARTARPMLDETIVHLARSGRFAGLRDDSADALRPLRLRPLLPAGFKLLSGDDATSLGFVAAGGDGAMSEVANIAPGLCCSIQAYCRQGRLQSARYLLNRLAPLIASLNQDSPAALKYALSLTGSIRLETRLPLVPLAGSAAVELAGILAAMADEDLVAAENA